MIATFNDPFEALFALQRALESRIGSEWAGDSTAGTGGYPAINIFEHGDDFVAVIELPGVDKNELQLEARQNAIRISGKKTINYDERASIHRRERVWGVFDRTFSLPIEVNPEAVRADCRDGVLVLTIPRAEREKPRTIQINS